MQTTNQSLRKLKSIARFLQISGKYHFVNYNLKLFFDFIYHDSEIGSIVKKLMNKYPDLEVEAKTTLTHPNQNLSDFRSKRKIETFEEWVAFCIFYVKAGSEQPGGNPFINKVIGQYDGSGYSKEREDVQQCFNEIIEPILIYIELQIGQSLNTLYILQRYKILCEWYERDDIKGKKETSITRGHLSKFLFDNGFTYSLSETSVPSGRIDNFAFNIGLRDPRELSKLTDAIIIEGKIYEGDKSVFKDVYNQVHKRVMELNFNEGYCVIFNKSNENIILDKVKLGGINSLYYRTIKYSKIFFLIVNLNDEFYSSKSTIKELKINTDEFSKNSE